MATEGEGINLSDNEIKRFSAIDYISLHRQKKKQEQGAEQQSVSLSVQHMEQFQQLCQEVRTYLSAAKGFNEEERRQYSETLNHAVLGFPDAREQIMALIADRLMKLHLSRIDGFEHPYPTLAEAVFAEVVGMNVLEVIIRETFGLEEIQVVGTKIYTVIGGVVRLSSYQFEHVKEVERIQQNLVLYNNDHINIRKRWAEVMLQNGSRVTMTGFGYTSLPTLTIRFYTLRNIPLHLLASLPYRMMNESILTLLNAILQARYNIVLIGPTNSGKTNLLKAMIAELPKEERLVTIEGRYEMMISRDYPDRNVIEYEINEDDYLHNSNQAFKLALRQSPERIIHAEIRDDDANIYVRACTRGHRGSMTTVHANHLEDVPEAIVDMCMLDGRGMDAERLAKRITEYVTEIGVQLRYINGRRVLTRIGRMKWQEGQAHIIDWVKYDEAQDRWEIYWNDIHYDLPILQGGVS